MKRILIITAVIFTALSSAAQTRKAVVGLSSVYMRQQPDYESALETQELMGTVVEIVAEKGYWREIVSPQPYRAWVTEKALVEFSDEQIKEYEAAPKLFYTGLYGHVYERPSLKSKTICDLVGGDLLRSVRGRLSGRWTEVMLPSGELGFVLTRDLALHNGFRSVKMDEEYSEFIAPDVKEAVIDEAMKMLGSPYLWGGMTAKGVDCSGLVRIAHIMNGILLPRNASQQVRCGQQISVSFVAEFWDEDVRNSRSDDFKKEMSLRVKNLKRGDLVFFGTPASEPKGKARITHVGIYLGEGRIIHSSHMVRVNSLIPGEEDFYENSHRLLAAVRL